MLTPFGICVFNIMAMGLSNSGDVFESSLCTCKSNLPGCTNIADDISYFWQDTRKSTTLMSCSFWSSCLDMNIKLNPGKAQINCKEVPYFGNILSTSGIKPDPANVHVIKDWPVPQSVKALQSFLGNINYMFRLISRLSKLREPMQQLVKKNTGFVWMDHHTKVFNSIKDAISADCLVHFFDPTKPIFIESDASLQGIGSIFPK